MTKGNFNVLKSIAGLVTATVAAQLIGLGFVPLLSRIYGPVEFGVFGTFVGAAVVAGVCATASYQSAIVVERDTDGARRVAWLSLFVLAGFSLCLAAAILGMRLLLPLFPSSFDPPLALLFAVALPVAVVSIALLRVLQSVFVRQAEFARVGRYSIAQALCVSGAQAAFGLFSPELNGLILGYVIGLCIVGASGAFSLRRRIWAPDETPNPSALFRIARAHWRFPAFFLPANLAEHGSVWIPVLLVGATFDAATAGAFLLAQRVVRFPVTLVSSNVRQVLFKSAAQAEPPQTANIAMLARKTTMLLGAIAVVPCLILYFKAEPFFLFVLGPEWGMAGRIASMLALLLFVEFSISPTIILLAIDNRQAWQMTWEFLRLGTIVILFTAVGPTAGPEQFFPIYAAVLSGVYIVGFLLVVLVRGTK